MKRRHFMVGLSALAAGSLPASANTLSARDVVLDVQASHEEVRQQREHALEQPGQHGGEAQHAREREQPEHRDHRRAGREVQEPAAGQVSERDRQPMVDEHRVRDELERDRA